MFPSTQGLTVAERAKVFQYSHSVTLEVLKEEEVILRARQERVVEQVAALSASSDALRKQCRNTRNMPEAELKKLLDQDQLLKLWRADLMAENDAIARSLEDMFNRQIEAHDRQIGDCEEYLAVLETLIKQL